MHRRAFLATGAATLTGGCLGVLGGEGGYDIGMTSQAFDPQTIEVDVGTEVVWQNSNSRGHTVTAYEDAIPDEADYFATGGFDSEQSARDAWREDGSGNIYGGDTFSYTVEVPGTYDYFCIPHESGGMAGRIEVRE
jgi:plastocyanin